MTAQISHACRIALVLAGGNALGAYQAGVYQALHDAGIEPDWIVGTSAGAINGAVIAGNPPERRLERLSDLWRPGESESGWEWWGAAATWRRTAEVTGTLLAGRPGLFAPAGSSLLSQPPAIYDTGPLGRTLASLVDFELLNDGPTRYSANAVDLDSGEEVLFDSHEQTITADHIRASAAMPPAFPPVAIDGRLYVDGGLSANLALDPVLSDPGTAPTLCIAVDLLPQGGARPDSLGTMAARTQDLIFSSQSRRTIDRWQERCADADSDNRTMTLVHLTYADQQPEVAGKAMDFSPASVRQRWNAGARDGSELVRWMAAAAGAEDGHPGLGLVRMPRIQPSST